MAQGYHDSDVIFTEESLIGFIKSIHDNIGDNYHFVSTIDMAHMKFNNINFTNGSYEKEIADYYIGTNGRENWETDFEGCICVINEEKEQDNGRYTWLKSGDFLDFKSKISHAGVLDDNNPYGTFRINRNHKKNLTDEEWIEVKGFSGGNFNSQTSGDTLTTRIVTDIIGCKNLGFNNDKVKTAYITDAYITNLKSTLTSITSSGVLTITNDTEAGRPTTATVNAGSIVGLSSLSGSIKTAGGIAAGKRIMGSQVHAAVFNDYAECRKTISLSPGHVVVDIDDGSLVCSQARLQPGAQVISDTYGNLMGETEDCQTPIAVAGRVLVYPYQNRENYHAGMAVCSAPDGTVDIMTRGEIRDYPDCIVGIVSEIPQYEKWGSNQVDVNGRIWIKVK